MDAITGLILFFASILIAVLAGKSLDRKDYGDALASSIIAIILLVMSTIHIVFDKL